MEILNDQLDEVGRSSISILSFFLELNNFIKLKDTSIKFFLLFFVILIISLFFNISEILLAELIIVGIPRNTDSKAGIPYPCFAGIKLIVVFFKKFIFFLFETYPKKFTCLSI